MQNNPNRDMIVGGLVVLLLGGLFAFSYAGITLTAKGGAGTFPITAVFNRVDGLFLGDDVRLAGIRVGTVGKQELDSHFRAIVTLQIDHGIELPVDSAAAIHTDGLFGSKFVVLEPGVEDALLKAGGDIQNTQGAVVVGELLGLIIDEGHARQEQANAKAKAKANATTNPKQKGN